jgi:hypothetical protein
MIFGYRGIPDVDGLTTGHSHLVVARAAIAPQSWERERERRGGSGHGNGGGGGGRWEVRR